MIKLLYWMLLVPVSILWRLMA